MQTSKAIFVVTDTETTGGSASRDRVIEIGAVKIQGDEVVDRFQRLINPQRAISRKITRITGISTAMVFDKPSMEEVLPEYLAFLGDDVLVAHNASFDVRFLNAECNRMDRPSIEQTALCTLRLARRLLPGLRSKGLSALIDFYQIGMVNRHRALGDAEATGVVLRKFLTQLRFEHNVETVSDVLRFQRKRYRDVRKVPNHIAKIRRGKLADLPDAPGVYTMHAANGSPIYIGKARSLKSRVRSYFVSLESHDGHRQRLVRKVRDVTWEEVPSELDAVILESRRIKEHRPKFNRAQRTYRRRPFLKLSTEKAYPDVNWTYKLDESRARYFGPLRSKKSAKWLVEVIDTYFTLRECGDAELAKGKRCYLADIERCTAPCELNRQASKRRDSGDKLYAGAVEQVLQFLHGEADELLETIEAAMRKAAREMQFERAAELRDEKKEVERFARRQRVTGGAAIDRNEILVLRKKGLRQIFVVRQGQHAATIAVDANVTEAHAELREALRLHYPPEKNILSDLSVRDIHEMRLLTQWMYRRRSDLQRVPWVAGEAERLVDKVMALVEGPVGKAA